MKGFPMKMNQERLSRSLRTQVKNNTYLMKLATKKREHMVLLSESINHLLKGEALIRELVQKITEDSING